MFLLQAGKCSAGPAGALQRLLGAAWCSSRHLGCASAAAYSTSAGGPSTGPPSEAEVDVLNQELDGVFGTEYADRVMQQPSGAPPGLPGPQRPLAARPPPREPVLNVHEELEYDALQQQKQQAQQQQEPPLVPTEPPLHPQPLKVAPSPVAPGHVASSGLPASHIHNRRKIDLGAADFEGRGPRRAAAAPPTDVTEQSRRNGKRGSRDSYHRERSSSSNSSNGSNGSSGMGHANGRLSHVDARGKAAMVDVADKASTVRDALASCRVLLGPEAFALVEGNKLSKGDVLTVAQLAGVMGAKHTSTLIPLCHNILISKVDVRLRLDAPRHSVVISASARSVGPTGVEMEALTAAAVAALTVYDMCKAVSKDVVISDLMLQRKSGGKSGTFQRVGSGFDAEES